jgi:prepilin-type processing-associated H-X9-DG protein
VDHVADWFYAKNGEKQGPVNSAGLKQLAASGQLLPDDLIWREGMTEWAKASKVKGLFAATASSPAAPVPPDSPAPSTSDDPYDVSPPALTDIAPQQPVALPYATPTPTFMPQSTERSGMALASLICGIIFCIPVCSLLAIIFGIIGIQQTGPGRRSGRGMAIAGLVLGCVGIPLTVVALLISILLPSLNRAREIANRVKCAANERSIGQAILLYENDFHGQYPPDLVTLAKTESVPLSVFVCPSSNDTPASSPDTLMSGGHCSYVYLGKGLTSQSDPITVVLCENSSDHDKGGNLLYADGHVEFDDKTSPNYPAAGLSSAPVSP